MRNYAWIRLGQRENKKTCAIQRQAQRFQPVIFRSDIIQEVPRFNAHNYFRGPRIDLHDWEVSDRVTRANVESIQNRFSFTCGQRCIYLRSPLGHNYLVVRILAPNIHWKSTNSDLLPIPICGQIVNTGTNVMSRDCGVSTRSHFRSRREIPDSYIVII